MSATILRDTLGLILLVAVSACGVKPIATPSTTFPGECTVKEDSAGLPDTITVALTDAADRERVVWSDHKLVVGQMFETLIRIDCLGGLHAGLADSWRSTDGGRRWSFDIRRSARFWDGSEVGADDVQRSLMRSAAGTSVIDSISVTGGRRIMVFAGNPAVNIPSVLARPSFAVRKTTGSVQGSGAFRVALSQSATSGVSTYTLKPSAYSLRQTAILQVVETVARDERDLLTRYADLLVTSDPAVLDYARRRNNFSTVPLPWDRTYVLLSTRRISALLSSLQQKDVSQTFRDNLARDAVRRDARGHVPSGWMDQILACTGGSPDHRREPNTLEDSDNTLRILYDGANPVAQQLAERIVALSGAVPGSSADSDAVDSAIPGIFGNSGSLRAHGVSREEMNESLGRGSETAYIVSQSLRPPDFCNDAGHLLRRAPWLVPLGDRLRRGLVPLVDTRQTLIVRKGKSTISLDWFGNIRIESGSFEK